jgi:hypothetical protein
MPRRDHAPLRLAGEESLQRRPVDVPYVGHVGVYPFILDRDLETEGTELCLEILVDRDRDAIVDLAEPAERPGAPGRLQFPLRAASPVSDSR